MAHPLSAPSLAQGKKQRGESLCVGQKRLYRLECGINYFLLNKLLQNLAV